jgi:hypothetical protein
MSTNEEPALHGKKVSDVFLEFVDPILKTLLTERPNAKLDEYDLTLQVPWMAWNAVVMQEAKHGSTDYVEMMEQMLAGQPPILRGLLEFWIERKRTVFSKYKYMIGEYRTYKREDGEIRFSAEARLNSYYN